MKNLVKFFYRKYLICKVFLKIFFNFSNDYKEIKVPKVYYAGAIKGDFGGPYVKIKKLNNFFPEVKSQFNIVYALSNSPNLTLRTINILKKKKIPLILNQNGVFYPSWYKGNWQKQNLFMANVYHSADYILWQSSFCKKASEKFLGRSFSKGEIIYNAVDTKKFSPKINTSSKFKLLITGNINKNNSYRITVVLQALKEIIKVNKSVHLLIAGYIEDCNSFSSLLESLNIRDFVTFLGPFDQSNAEKIYQTADAYITMSYQDNCPSAVIEAMSCGLPILYSASGGIPELVGINSGVGLEVPCDWEKVHTPKIEKIVEGFLKMYEDRKNMSDSARTRAVELFAIEKWYTKHLEIFENNLRNI